MSDLIHHDDGIEGLPCPRCRCTHTHYRGEFWKCEDCSTLWTEFNVCKCQRCGGTGMVISRGELMGKCHHCRGEGYVSH